MRTASLPTLTLTAIMLLAGLVPWPARADDAAELVAQKSVLVLHSGYQGDPLTDRIHVGLRQGLAEAGSKIELWTEYMGLPRTRGQRYRDALVSLLEAKYAGRGFDAVVTSGGPALELVMAHRRRSLFRAPVVFSGVDAATAARFGDDPQVTGVVLSADLSGTLDVALALHPWIERVVFISPDFEGHMSVAPIAASHPELEIDVWHDALLEDIENRLAPLGNGTLVIPLGAPLNAAAVPVDVQNFARTIVSYTAAPVYTPWDLLVGHGAVGGHVTDTRAHGETAGRKILRAIGGDAGLPGITTSPMHHLFDHQQLQRLGATLSALPEDSRMINAPKRFFEIERDTLMMIVAALVALVAAVMVLTLNIIDRHEMQRVLVQSERRLDLALQVSQDGLWDWNLLTGECYYSPRWCQAMGLDPARVAAHVSTWEDRVHPDDLDDIRANVARHQAGASDIYESEHRVMHADGRYRWHRVRAKVVAWTDSGRPARMIGVESDVTHRRETERDLRQKQAQLDAIFQNSPAEIFLKDSEGRYLRISREFERRFNVRNRDVVGKLPEDIHHESLGTFAREHDREVLKTGRPVLREERAVPGNDGKEQIFLTLKFPTFDENGEVTGLGAIATDVTDYKRTERELAERDRLLRLVHDHVPMLLAYVDRELRFRTVNREAEQWYRRPLDQIIGRSVEEVVGPEAWAQIRPDAARALNGERVHLDGPRNYAGGTLWVTGSVVPDVDEDGAVHGYCLMAVDITQRKKAEDAVTENERLLRLIYDNVPVMLAYVDRDLRYRTVNAACAEWFGKPLDRIIGHRVPDVVGAEAWVEIEPEANRAFAGETVTVDRLRPYAGGARWVSGSVAPNFDEEGEVQGYFVLLADISERKRAEEKLKLSEERLRLVADNVPGMITRVDADRRFRFINREAERWLGLPQEEAVGRRIRDVIGEASYQSLEPYIDRVLCGEQVSFEMESSYKQGKSRWIAGTLTPDYGSQGRVRGYYAMLLDVSERRQAQEAARRAQRQLIEQQRNEQASVERELDRVRDQLISKTRLAAIGAVAASVAHDLRNPLGAIRNAKFYLSRRLPESEGRWREYLEVMEREIVTADRIIHDLLDMTRSKPPELEETDLEAAVRDAFQRVDAGAVSLEIVLEREPFLLSADPDQLARVLDNLLLNAVQAMGGDGTIVVEARSDGEFECIRIRDSGPGVAADLRAQLFEPLITTKAKGTGLGLAVCRQVVERHGGRISLERSDESGAEFLIELPRSSRLAGSGGSPRAAGAGLGAG